MTAKFFGVASRLLNLAVDIAKKTTTIDLYLLQSEFVFMPKQEKNLEAILEVLKDLVIIQGNIAQHIADLRLWAFKDHAKNERVIHELEMATRTYQFETFERVTKYMDDETREVIEKRLKEMRERFL